MGKVKRLRQKFHAASAKAKEKSKGGQVQDGMMDDSQLMPPPPPPQFNQSGEIFRGQNVFENMNISSLDLVKQKLPDFDARSSITSKTFKGMNMSKKEKQKLRHEALMAKIDTIQSAKQKARERKRKQKTPVVGDLSPMEDALPTLELLLKKSTGGADKSQPLEKDRSIPKEKKRRKQMMDDISLFHKVIEHPVFQADSGSTIKEHLRNKLLIDEEKERMDM